MPLALPEQFRFAHNLAFATHDLLADHVVEGEKAGLLYFEVPLRSAGHAAEMEGLEGEALWDWFISNGYADVVVEHSYRNLVFALLSDLCQFVYEALRCSAKGKLSVAFALLRKPLQDNLFYLEWLLADREGFLAKFRQGPEHLDFGRLEKELKKSTRVDVIGRAMDRTPAGRWVEPEFLYELRYEKASDVGLDGLFNHALHLVTTFKHYATQPENINFIFCDEEDRDDLWRQLYLLLPLVLRHALHVVRELFKSIAPDFEPFDHTTELWLTVGFLLWSGREDAVEGREAAAEFFRELFEGEPLACPACGHPIDFDTPNMRRFWKRGQVKCHVCRARVRLLDLTPNGPGSPPADDLPEAD